MTNPTFHILDRASWERTIHFDYYYHQIKCRYNLTANIDITALMRYKEEHKLKFFPTMLFILITAVNRNKEFRMSFNEAGELGYWEEVVPAYTLFHPEDHTFTDIWSKYDSDFDRFYQTVLSDIATYKEIRGVIKARPDQPKNFCPISCLPWLSFESFAQDTYCESTFLFPLLKFGKYRTEQDKTVLPVALFVSHAVADGYHSCKLINDIQELAAHPEVTLGHSGSNVR